MNIYKLFDPNKMIYTTINNVMEHYNFFYSINHSNKSIAILLLESAHDRLTIESLKEIYNQIKNTNKTLEELNEIDKYVIINEIKEHLINEIYFGKLNQLHYKLDRKIESLNNDIDVLHLSNKTIQEINNDIATLNELKEEILDEINYSYCIQNNLIDEDIEKLSEEQKQNILNECKKEFPDAYKAIEKSDELVNKMIKAIGVIRDSGKVIDKNKDEIDKLCDEIVTNISNNASSCVKNSEMKIENPNKVMELITMRVAEKLYNKMLKQPGQSLDYSGPNSNGQELGNS